jgi:PAS domain S-box-containing protein
MFGYYLDDSVLARISNQLQSKLTIYNYDQIVDDNLLSIRSQLIKQSGIVITRPNNQILYGYTLIKDVFGKPALILKEELPRDVFTFSQKSMLIFTAMLGSFGMILVILILILLESFVLRRLMRLTGEVAEIGTKGSLSLRVKTLGGDELGLLAENINYTLEKLEAVTREKEYQQSQKESILEIMGEGVLVTDIDKKIIYVNPSFEHLLGYSFEVLKGHNFAQVFEVFDLNGKPLPVDTLDVNDTTFTTGAGSIVRVMLAGKDRKIAVIVNTAPIKVNGKIEGAVRTIYDYTPELAMQKQKDDFFSFASHELRTPMTVIKGNLQIVLDGMGGTSLTDTDKESLRDAKESSDRLIKLVNEFLNVSRIDQGRIEMEIKEVNVCELLQQVVKEMSSLYANKGLSLEFTCDLPQFTVKADPNKLKEVFINLLGNSVKFTEKGGVTITHEKRGDVLFIHFRDTGIGIPEDQAKQLFNRFQQVTNERGARTVEGSGLGLFICRQFVTLMKGDVWIEKTEVGAGTTIAVSLPLSG